MLTLLERLLCILLKLLDTAAHILKLTLLGIAYKLRPTRLLLHIVVIEFFHLRLHRLQLLLKTGYLCLEDSLSRVATRHDLHQVVRVDVAKLNALLCHSVASQQEEAGNNCN